MAEELFMALLFLQNIKARTNSLTRRRETEVGHAQNKRNIPVFCCWNPLKFNPEGSGVKSLDGL
ncbi:hypothetical protein ACMDB5_06090 [Flavobacterium sp. W1B]|uniref:hypothetical protein n=1 Tax=Flavobacterium sp. W1B TaxID=3394146 RepID=UPI0039BD7FA7